MMGLGNIRHAAGAFCRRHVLHIPFIHGNNACLGHQQAQQALEQRTLSHSVGTQHREKLSLLCPEGNILQHRMAAVSKPQLFHRKTHARSPPFVMRYRKKGAPI